MSYSVDQRIVQMRFDNAQFEQGAKESLKTLDTLRDSLKFEGASNSLKGLSVAPITEGIYGLIDGFNALDVVAITVISNITSALMGKLGDAFESTIGQIYSGGLKRATNLEQARFAMQGLLYDTEKAGDEALRYGFGIEDVMREGGPVQNAVKDTAYGLDEAAKAASNFIASGVTDLGKLELVLKSISGTAAQTGSSYEDIAHIYTRIAGNNRLYAIDLQSFAARGVNAAAAIRDYLNSLDETVNYTEADIRDMVSDGAINLELFANAMWSAFGPNAFRANETYAGSLANLNASLSRIGEALETPKLQNMTKIFNALREAFNALKPAIMPVLDVLVDFSTKNADFVVGKIQKIRDWLTNLNETVKKQDALTNNKRNTLAGLIEGTDVDPSETEKALEGFVSPFQRLANSMRNFVQGFKNLGLALANAFSPFFSVIKRLISNLFPITPTIESISEKFLKFTEHIKESSASFSDAVKEFKETNKWFKLLESTIKTVTTAFSWFVGTSVQFIAAVTKTLGPVFISIIGKALKFLEPLAEKLTEFFNLVSILFTEKINTSKLRDSLTEVFNTIYSYIDPLTGKMSKLKDTIVNFFKSILNTIHEIAPELTLENVFGWLMDFKIGNILKTFTGITDPIKTVVEYMSILSNVSSIDEAVNTIASGPNKIAGRVARATPIISRGKDALLNFKDGILDASKGVAKSEDGFSILDKIGSAISKIWETLKSVGSKITGGFSELSEGIKNFFSSFDLASFSAIIVGLGSGGLMLELRKFIKLLRTAPRDLTKAIEDFLGAIAKMTESIGKAFNRKATAEMISSMKDFGIALLLTTVAFKLLEGIDWKTALEAGLALAEVAVVLTGAFILLSKFSAVSSTFSITKDGIFSTSKKFATDLIAFAAALLILSVALKQIASIKEDVQNAVLVLLELTGIIVLYAAAMALINKIGSTKGTVQLISMGLSLLVVAKSIEKLGQINPDVLEQGIQAIKDILIAIGLFNLFSAFSGSKSSVSAGAGILLIATSLLVFVGAIELLGRLDPTIYENAFKVMGSLFIAVGLFMVAVQEAKPIQTAASLLILAAALVAIAGAMAIVGSIPFENLNPIAIIAMMGALAAIAIVLRALGDAASLKGALAITVVAASLIVLANAFLVMSLVPFTTLLTNLLVIIGGLAALGAISGLIGKASVALLMVSKAFALMGASVLAIAVAITLLTPVLGAFTISLLGSLYLLVEGLIEMKDQLAKGMAAIIEIILIAVLESAGLIKELIVGLLTIVLQALTEIIEPLKEFLITLLTALIDIVVDVVSHGIMKVLTAVDENIEDFTRMGLTIGAHFLDGLAAGLPELVQSSINLLITWIETLADGILNNAERLGEAGWNLLKALVLGMALGIKGFTKEPLAKIKELGSNLLTKAKEFINAKAATSMIWGFIKGLIDKIGSTISSVVSKIRELGSKMIAKLKEFISFDKVKQIGKDLIEGLKNGINSLKDSAVEAVKGVGEKIISGIKGLFGIHSPSSVFNEIGVNTIQGLNNGMSSQESASTSTIKGIGNTLLSSIKGIFNKDAMNTVGKDGMSGLSTGMNSQTSSSKTTATSIINQIKQLMNQSEEFDKIGQELINGLVKGIKKKEVAARDQVRSSSKTIANVARQTMEVASPSKLFMRIGEYCMEGLAIGLDDTREAEKNLEALRKTVSEALSGDLTDIGEPVIRPVLDLSEIQNGASRIDGLLSNSGGIIGSVSANIRDGAHNNSVIDAISKLSDRLNQRLDQELSAEEIYSAIQRGVSDANFLVRISGREVTSMVNEINNDSMTSMLEYLGG